MQKIFGKVESSSGSAQTGATITVVTWPDLGGVTLYGDDEETVLANPLTVNPDGTYEFNVPDGTYRISAKVGSSTVHENKVIIQDTRWGPRILGRLDDADFDSTSDQTIRIDAGKYIIEKIIVYDASISLTTAEGGIYTGAGKTGTAVVPAAQSYSVLTGSSKFEELTLDASMATDVQTSGQLYLSLTTPQGSTATANILVIGQRLED